MHQWCIRYKSTEFFFFASDFNTANNNVLLYYLTFITQKLYDPHECLVVYMLAVAFLKMKSITITALLFRPQLI